MIKSQTPDRIKWDEAVLRAMCDADLCRSDAKAIVETAKNEVVLDAMFKAGIGPASAAKRLLE